MKELMEYMSLHPYMSFVECLQALKERDRFQEDSNRKKQNSTKIRDSLFSFVPFSLFSAGA